jgi:hypothetical protein
MRKVYARQITPGGEIARSVLLLLWALTTLPIKIVWAMIQGLVGGTSRAYIAGKPRKKRFE